MMAALSAARAGAKVTLLERNDRIGKKILMTGNGKCNFSNLSFSDSCYYSNEKAKAGSIYAQLPPKETVRLFEELGMRIREKNGYLYPASEQASTVLDVLRFALEEAGVKMICGAQAERVTHRKNGFLVRCQNGAQFDFDRLILACGGEAAPKTGSDGNGYRLAGKLGHQICPTVPALVQLRCKGSFWKSVSGIRCDARLKLVINGRVEAEERGELQVTDYGISGIVVFQFSRIAAYALAEGKKTQVWLDLLPDESEESLRQFAQNRYERYPDRTAEAFFTGIIHKKWMQYFMKEHGFRPENRMRQYQASQAEALLLHMKRLEIEAGAVNSFEHAQVSAGGVSLAQVHETLESTLIPGLYFAGELLDVDGKCGGYNLQWAWSSGYTAGREAARR